MSANTAGPIRSVKVVQTGTGAMHKEHRHGSRLPQMLWVLTSRSWIEMPVNCFLIEHRDGLVLFDAGIDPAIASDPNYISQAIGRFLMRRIFQLHIGPEDALDKRLEALGYAATDVNKVVFSHLHFDHIGGINHMPQAELLVSTSAWRHLHGLHPERDWVLREHIEIPGARWRQIDFAPTDDSLFAPFGGCHDVMGDGSMILLPTPGHAPGSLSMLVRSEGIPPLLFVGDLAYERDLLMADRVPGTGEAQTLRDSYAKVRGLAEHLPGLVILPSHDFTAAKDLEEGTRLL